MTLAGRVSRCQEAMRLEEREREKGARWKEGEIRAEREEFRASRTHQYHETRTINVILLRGRRNETRRWTKVRDDVTFVQFPSRPFAISLFQLPERDAATSELLYNSRTVRGSLVELSLCVTKRGRTARCDAIRLRKTDFPTTRSG